MAETLKVDAWAVLSDLALAETDVRPMAIVPNTLYVQPPRPSVAPPPPLRVVWLPPANLYSHSGPNGSGALDWTLADVSSRVPAAAQAAILRVRYWSDYSADTPRIEVRASPSEPAYLLCESKVVLLDAVAEGSAVQPAPVRNGRFEFRQVGSLRQWALDLYGYIG